MKKAKPQDSLSSDPWELNADDQLSAEDEENLVSKKKSKPYFAEFSLTPDSKPTKDNKEEKKTPFDYLNLQPLFPIEDPVVAAAQDEVVADAEAEAISSVGTD